MIKRLLVKTFIDQPNCKFLINNVYTRCCELLAVGLCDKIKGDFVQIKLKFFLFYECV